MILGDYYEMGLWRINHWLTWFSDNHDYYDDGGVLLLEQSFVLFKSFFFFNFKLKHKCKTGIIM